MEHAKNVAITVTYVMETLTVLIVTPVIILLMEHAKVAILTVKHARVF